MALIKNNIFIRRITIAIIFIILAFVVALLRNYKLQVVDYDKYQKQALGNFVTLVPLVPRRGKIFDRNGILLAENKLAYRLIITPELVKDIKFTLNSLKKQGIISQQDIDKYSKNRKKFKKFDNIIIRKKLKNYEVDRFLVRNSFLGVEVEAYFHRYYPDGAVSSHIVGYVAAMNIKDKNIYNSYDYKGTTVIGKIGIERQYEELLHGKRGVLQIERDVYGRVISEKIIKNSIKGSDVYLTIDVKLQKKALETMNRKRGSIVVTDVRNGEVLAMVSSPSFDNNLFVGGVDTETYKELIDDKDLPLFNRAITGTYPPGSTIKPIMALIGLENKVIDKHSTVNCTGHYKLPNYSRKFNDWKRTGHGKVNVVDSIAQSCDVFFYDLAKNMGIDMIHNGLNNFYIGKMTGIDIPGEDKGVSPSKAWKRIYKKKPWYRGETLITGIGQGFMTATPLQLALATGVIANKGLKFVPRLVKQIIAKPNSVVQLKDKFTQVSIQNIDNWNLVAEGMREAVYNSKGTARRLNRSLKYTLAGKTGTAQVFGLDPEEEYIASKYEEKLRDHALFVGFAPIEEPNVAISVIVENAGSGSSKAAPLAKKVLDFYFEQK